MSSTLSFRCRSHCKTVEASCQAGKAGNADGEPDSCRRPDCMQQLSELEEARNSLRSKVDLLEEADEKLKLAEAARIAEAARWPTKSNNRERESRC